MFGTKFGAEKTSKLEGNVERYMPLAHADRSTHGVGHRLRDAA